MRPLGWALVQTEWCPDKKGSGDRREGTVRTQRPRGHLPAQEGDLQRKRPCGLLFNTLSRFVITFLLKRKHLLISWLQSPSAVIFELKKIKSVTASIVSLSICHEAMEPDAMIFVF